jgi:membrane protease YdiL (CAAX protease family)
MIYPVINKNYFKEIFMNIFYIALIIVFYIINAVLEMRYIHKMKDTAITEMEKIKNYKESIIQSWIPVFAVIIICIFSTISFNDVGLRPISFQYNIWFTVITIVVSGSFFVILLYQIISYLTSAKYREKVKTNLHNSAAKSHYDAVMNNIAIPRSRKEKQLFFWLALTAGFGEELVFRGFLYHNLHAIFTDISLIIIMLIGSITFGLLHIYQSFSGVIKTTILGALLGCLYLVTGSLIPGILLHFFIDFSATFALSEE